MSVNLFPHNQIAYNSALEMLESCGKAAIVHPTGTGKSFIGFKLCEEKNGETVCWLSPSEYIFKTQIENLKKAGGEELTNICFYTYAKLMLMSEEELSAINPTYIVLDEFHRCGAEMWGEGVQRLLRIFSNARILGLSATAIRYLDNQRDMVAELFDGNVASEITLGEAIVKGILNPPKYVLSIFSCQKDLEKYEARVRRTKAKVVRDAATVYLDALRRTLEKAEGLEEIFYKHMTEKNGKYIVFCANYEHMQEMMSHTEWFSKVDKKPRLYSVYSSDPSASKSFQAFKEDQDYNHLRLLYCIDALNEGIHLDDISGVILLRPTVSPIIYKQQIGRALSASKKNHAVIFDIVLNIENLYSIGAIEEEMEIATTYYRYLGEQESIVNEHFQIIDEVRDCRVLFEKLNDTLTASWELMYKHAKDYYHEVGDLEVPARYLTADGYCLGKWIFNQRGIRKGTIEGSLTEEQIKKLDAIAMVWDKITDLNWNRNYEAAKAYFEENGDLNVSSRYVTKEGVTLGGWLSNIRTWAKSDVHQKYLTEERKAQLNAIGMVWDVLDFFWENNFAAAIEYYRKHGNLEVASNYITPNGVRLGSWISRLRKLRAGTARRGTPPTQEQIARLDAIGMVWTSNIEYKWDRAYTAAEAYYRKFGNLDVPMDYKTDSGLVLGAWVKNQRKRFILGRLEEERKVKLDAIGMVWTADGGWMSRYELLKKYYEKHGTICISQSYVEDGVWLGKWIVMQKKYYEQGKLSDEQAKLLRALPLEQVSPENKAWYTAYEDAVDYWKKHGHLNMAKDYQGKSGIRLGAWLIVQRRKKKLGELTEEQIKLLEDVGFEWEISRWLRGYRYAQEYYNQHGHLNMPRAYKCEDGYALGIWVFNYRNAYNGNKSVVEITQEQIQALEEIGMEWKPDAVWDKNYVIVAKFVAENNTLPSLKATDDTEKKCAQWLYNQRKSYRLGYLTESKLKRLAEIGITEEWLAPQKTPFEKGYLIAKAHFEECGTLDVPTNFQHKSGFWLGSWIDKIRKKKDELTDEQIERLDEIGFVWEQIDTFEERFAIAKAYYEIHGVLPLEPKHCKDQAELHICQWLRRQLIKRNEGKLEQDRIDRLSAIGMDWLNTNERAWERGYGKAKEYYEVNGNLEVKVSYVCADGYPLGEWLHSQRTHRKRLPKAKLDALVNLGMVGIV